ncbi:hypothetical protein B0H14DRAFT_2891195, partial [Mycena olivaceomarginata]
MGYVRAVGARVSFDAAADGDGGGGVELKVKFSSRKMPESSISCSSGSSSFPAANCVGANSTLVDLGLPAQLSQLDVQLPRARAYEGRDGDAAASPRAAYSGASGVAGVVVGGVRLAAPIHHLYRALRGRVRVLVYALPIERRVRHGGGRDERVRAVGAGVAGGVREGGWGRRRRRRWARAGRARGRTSRDTRTSRGRSRVRAAGSRGCRWMRAGRRYRRARIAPPAG